jgi:hypothetical protein
MAGLRRIEKVRRWGQHLADFPKVAGLDNGVFVRALHKEFCSIKSSDGSDSERLPDTA